MAHSISRSGLGFLSQSPVLVGENVRIYLDFHVCGQPMGSEVKHTGPRRIEVRAASEVAISRIEIVKNGDDYLSAEPNGNDVTWDEVDNETDSPAWYYVRVTRADGEMAWSSPVWVGV